jgi:hypothetical protein
MRTRKTSSASNYKSSAASQEFYTDDYNYVGIVNFPGLNLTNKVITQIKLKVTAAEAGYGAGITKTVYVRESKYQAASQSGITGSNYYGPALGTFTGSFYGNTTTNTLSGTLFTNLAAYLSEGNNTICLFNPNPSTSSQGYSSNYMQWDACQIIVTYEEAASVPTTSPTSLAMGSAVTINTNRLSSSATHTLKYAFGSATGTIATDVGDSASWTPPVSLASQIPSATSGVCTITCETYYGGVLTGTKTCQITLSVPSSIAPTISSVTHAENVSGLAAQFAAYVQSKSKLNVSISAAGAYGSTITTYRATLDGVTYTAASFTTGFLVFSGTKPLSVTVTDSRGRTATTSVNVTIVAYTPPSISAFSAERCSSDGSAPQQDGTKVRVNITAGAASVGAKNTMTCAVYYKLSSASAWTLAQNVTPTSYAVSKTNFLLSPTFNALSSYDIKVAVTDFFTTSTPVEQEVGISTKQVMQDFYRDGTGVAFGKVAEVAGAVEFGWPWIFGDPTTQTTSVKNLLFIGTNPDFEDTVGNWSARGFGWVWYTTTASSVTNKPTTYGFLLNIPVTGEAEVHQLYFAQNHSTIYHRSGNGSGWGGDWKTLFDSDTVVPISSGGTGQTSAAGIRSAIGLGNTTSALPVANGGHGATSAKQGLINLGIFYSATLPASGTDGQICLVPVS